MKRWLSGLLLLALVALSLPTVLVPAALGAPKPSLRLKAAPATVSAGSPVKLSVTVTGTPPYEVAILK